MLDKICQTIEIMFNEQISSKVKEEDTKIFKSLSKNFKKGIYAISIRECTNKYKGDLYDLFDLPKEPNKIDRYVTNYDINKNKGGVFFCCFELSIDSYEKEYERFNYGRDDFILLADENIENTLLQKFYNQQNIANFDINKYFTKWLVLDELVDMGNILIKMEEDDEFKQRTFYFLDKIKPEIEKQLEKNIKINLIGKKFMTKNLANTDKKVKLTLDGNNF